MRPGDASQPLLICMNCCHQHCSLSAPSPVNMGLSRGGLCCLAAMKVRMLHPPLDLICHIQVGRQLVLWKRNGRQGWLSHQGTSWAQRLPYFPWLPASWWRSPSRVGSDPRRGEGAQEQGDNNIHKMRVEKERAQAGSN